MNSRAIFFWMLLTFPLLSMHSVAQDDEDAEASSSDEQVQQEPEASEQSGSSAKSSSGSSPDIFRPSEQVSEDLSVSFPADI